MYEYPVAYIGIAVGCLCRTILPYLEKKPPEGFDYNYAKTFVAAIITSIIVASLLISNVTIGDGPVSLTLLFASQVLEGWGATDVFNKLGIDWRTNKA